MSLLSVLEASQSAVESSDQALQAAEKALTAAQTAYNQAKEVLRAVTEAFVQEDRKQLVSTKFEGPRKETKEFNFNRLSLVDCETDEADDCFLSTNKNPVNDIDDEESTEDEETSGQKYLLISSTPELQELRRKAIVSINKFSPQKFQELQIDSIEKLSLCTDLVFEKAVDESYCSVACASMCNELQSMTVSDVNGIKTNFRKLLIMRCQKEFEKDYMEGVNRERHVSEMEATTDEEEKKRIKGEYEALERKLRKRSLGIMRYGIHKKRKKLSLIHLSFELKYYPLLGF